MIFSKVPAAAFASVPAGGVHCVVMQFLDPLGQASTAFAGLVAATKATAAPADATFLNISRLPTLCWGLMLYASVTEAQAAARRIGAVNFILNFQDLCCVVLSFQQSGSKKCGH